MVWLDVLIHYPEEKVGEMISHLASLTEKRLILSFISYIKPNLGFHSPLFRLVIPNVYKYKLIPFVFYFFLKIQSIWCEIFLFFFTLCSTWDSKSLGWYSDDYLISRSFGFYLEVKLETQEMYLNIYQILVFYMCWLPFGFFHHNGVASLLESCWPIYFYYVGSGNASPPWFRCHELM